MLHRRTFLKAALGPVALATVEQNVTAAESSPRDVIFMGDGLSLSPDQYASLLSKLLQERSSQGDVYLKKGVVEELERTMAGVLGKERALFLPTGTLANHLAVRVLAGETRKALVQAESHLYRDEGDCAQLLSGINLVPLGPGRATLTVDEVRAAVESAAGPPYPAPVGAISIESPVRRTDEQAFDYEEMKKVCAYARSKNIGTHLDGARVFLAAPYTGISPAQYAALFDTVYISLYKYFNAPFGAILAGPAPLMAKVETLRHQFGSLIYQGWETALIALHFLDGFAQRYETAVQNSNKLFELLAATGKFQIERVKSGTNVCRLRRAGGGSLEEFQQRLGAEGVRLRKPQDGAFMLQVNETINRRTPQELARAFVSAVS